MNRHSETNMMRIFMGGLACFLGLAVTSHATELTGNVNLSGGATLTATPDSIESQADNRTYKWSDKNGDGTDDDPADANLDMKTYNIIRNNDTTGFTLDLYDGTTNGSIIWVGPTGGSLSTTHVNTDYNSGPITIENADNISLKELDTVANRYGNGGAVSISQNGNLTVTGSIMTYPEQFSGSYSAPIDLIGGGDVAGTPVGALQIGGDISAIARNPRRIYIRGYESVNVSGSLQTTRYSTLQSTSDHRILILNIGEGGIEIGGSIETSDGSGSRYAYHPSSQKHVELQTAGAVQVDGSILTWTVNDKVQYQAGNITITATNDIGIAGAMNTRSLTTQTGNNSRNSGDITLTSAAGSVSVNSVNTRLSTSDSSRRAGNVNVTAAGDITLTGGIDLYASTVARRGSLSLTAGAAGSVTLASLDMDLINVATIESGLKSNRLTGALNVDLEDSGGSGTAASPFLLTTTRLQMPDDQRLYYLPEENSGLEGKVYRVADENGNPGQGGLLMVEPVVGTLITIR